MALFELGDLDATFADMTRRRAEWRLRCEQAVVRWRWADGPVYDPRPLARERTGFGRGRWLAAEPADPHEQRELGLDAQDRVVIERRHIRFPEHPQRRWFYETLYLHTDDRVEAFLFPYHPDDGPIACGIGTLDDGRLQRWEYRARAGCSRERFTWNGNRVVRIDIEQAAVAADGSPRPLQPFTRFEADHGPDGRLQRLTQCYVASGKSAVVFERPSRGATGATLAAACRDRLQPALVDAIRQAGVQEPVCCIALPWSPGQQRSLPPSVAFGLQRERRAWMAEPGWQAVSIWNPAEFATWREVKDEALDTACHALDQWCAQRGSWKSAGDMLVAIAAELSRHDWSGVLTTSDDFVVYAVDVELTDLARSLRRCSPPPTFSLLRQRGLLPKPGR